MSEDDKCSACGACLKTGLSRMEDEPAPQCAVCGAALAAIEIEQPYTIEFASDQRAARHPKTRGEITLPALRAGMLSSPDVFWTATTQEGETP